MKNKVFKRTLALFVSVLMIFSVMFMLCGCSKNKPEDAVDGYFTAMFKTYDTKAFIEVMSPPRFEDSMKKAGVKEEDYEDNVKILLYGVGQQLETTSTTVTWKIDSVEKYDEHEATHLKEHYKEEYGVVLNDIKLVKSTATQKSNEKTESKEFKFVVVKIDNQWYIDTVES